ncbi:MAG: hypothetical protein RIS09_1298, partial [Actinomycetota bacterium]
DFGFEVAEKGLFSLLKFSRVAFANNATVWNTSSLRASTT